MRTIALLAIATILVPWGSRAALTEEEKQLASALYKKFTASNEDLVARSAIVDEMLEMGSEVGKVIHPIIDREFRTAAPRYRSGYQKVAKALAAKKDSREKNQRIEKLRAEVQSLRKKGGNLSKEEIKKVGDPALKELRTLTRLESDEILASSEALAKARADLVELAKQRAACIDALILIDHNEFDEQALAAEEEGIATKALNVDRDAQKVLEQNKKLASEVGPAEAEGVADLNELRILIGLRPCLIDPKLCAAARDHSKDMGEKKFFAHDSPVPGKKTPWMRAKNFGTNANSENIYVGSPSGKAANKAWWYSPGHHVNMLAPGARRVGMGLTGKHWTQMFGG